MASSEGYLRFLLDQFSDLHGVTYRPMMGEYLLYYQGKLFGGVYDDRLLVKPINAAVSRTEAAGRNIVYARPYEGAKEMLLVEDVDDRAFLSGLVEAMYGELPAPKQRKSGKNGTGNMK